MPTEHPHHGRSTGGGEAGFSQRMTKYIAAKITEKVVDCITDIPQVQILLGQYIMGDLCKGNPPDPVDRSCFPLDGDVKNHVYMARYALPALLPRQE